MNCSSNIEWLPLSKGIGEVKLFLYSVHPHLNAERDKGTKLRNGTSKKSIINYALDSKLRQSQ